MGEHETQESQTITIPCPDGLSPEAHGALAPLVSYDFANGIDSDEYDIIALHQTKWLIITAWLAYRRSGKYPPGLPVFDSQDFKDRELFASFLHQLFELAIAVMPLSGQELPPELADYEDPYTLWKACLLEWKQWEIDYLVNLPKQRHGKREIVEWRRNNLLGKIKGKDPENPFPNHPKSIHNHRLLACALRKRQEEINKGGRSKFIRYTWKPFTELMSEYQRDQDRNPGLKSPVVIHGSLQYLEKKQPKKQNSQSAKIKTIALEWF
jgi:hypothetical protein